MDVLTPIQPGSLTESETIVEDETALDPPYDVVIHKDDVTPIDFVIIILYSVFKLTWSKARLITYVANTTGKSYVTTLTLEDTKYRVGNAHSAARKEGYPHSFSIKPN